MEDKEEYRKNQEVAQFLNQLSEKEKQKMLGEVASDEMSNLIGGTQGLASLGDRDKLRIPHIKAYENCVTMAKIYKKWAKFLPDDEEAKEVKDFFENIIGKKHADVIAARSQTKEKVPKAFLEALAKSGMDVPFVEPEEEEEISPEEVLENESEDNEETEE